MSRPHILLIILDSARRDLVGCYGHGGGLTPHMDALAREALILGDHYAAGCGSSQAHVSLFTGQHPARHGMVHNLAEMRQDLTALPLLLADLGYRSFGHCMASFIPPVGYEKMFGFEELVYPGDEGRSGNGHPLGVRLLHYLRRYPVMWTFLKETYAKVMGEEKKIEAYARLFDGTASVDYLAAKFESEAHRGPLFGYTTLLHPHTPYYPPRWCLKKVFNGQRIDKLSFKIQSDLHGWMNGDYGAAEAALESLRKCYQAELLYADHLVGRLVERLREAGHLENTILIVTADHGEMLGEHGVLNHGATVWEELFRVPCLIRYPARFRAGMRINALTSALDLVPTLLEWVGGSALAPGRTVFDGLPILRAAEEAGRMLVVDSPPVILPERLKKYPNLAARLSIISRAVRSAEFKYIWQSNGKRTLFRTGAYEEEANNLLAGEPERAEGMHEVMVRFYQGIQPGYKLEEYPIRIGTAAALKMANPVIRRELQRLGYL